MSDSHENSNILDAVIYEKEKGVNDEKNNKISNNKGHENSNKLCVKCNKTFKAKKSYNSHVKLQVCYKEDEITYCKICDITLQSHNDYIKHLISMEHLNCIGCNKLEVLQRKEPSKILLADPYLSNEEAKNIGTNNLGNKYTFIYDDNNTQIINLKFQNQSVISNSNVIDNSEYITTNDTVKNNNIPESYNIPIRSDSPESVCSIDSIESIGHLNSVTNRHIKLYSILEKYPHIEERKKMLLKILTNEKLSVNDYNGLTEIIKHIPENNETNIQTKNIYMSVIQYFTKLLIKEKNNGNKSYKGKDIMEIVIAIS